MKMTSQFMDKLKEIFEEENREIIPIAIIKDDEALAYLDEELDHLSYEFKKQHEELEETFRLRHSERWAKIKARLLEKGLIQLDKKYSFEIKDGVIYQSVKIRKDCESECESEE